jgi:hypothetical protein
MSTYSVRNQTRTSNLVFLLIVSCTRGIATPEWLRLSILLKTALLRTAAAA